MANFQLSQNNFNLVYLSLSSFEADKMLDLSGQKFLSLQEGTRYKAYQDSKGIWTIGRGIKYYENGVKVKKGDQITLEREIQLLKTPFSILKEK